MSYWVITSIILFVWSSFLMGVLYCYNKRVVHLKRSTIKEIPARTNKIAGINVSHVDQCKRTMGIANKAKVISPMIPSAQVLVETLPIPDSSTEASDESTPTEQNRLIFSVLMVGHNCYLTI